MRGVTVSYNAAAVAAFRSISRGAVLARGRAAIEHNKLVAESGEGELQEVRETDLSVKAAKRRFPPADSGKGAKKTFKMSKGTNGYYRKDIGTCGKA